MKGCVKELASERRRNTLFSAITDNIAVGRDSKRKLDSIDKDIDAYLYEVKDDARKMQVDADETYEKLKHINSPYNDILTTDNLLEFLTQNTLVNINNVYRKQKQVLNMNKNGDIAGSKQQINEILMNTDVSQLLSAEKDRITKYSDYRLIDAYIPQVSRCINTYRDSILSPDDNNKTDITIEYKMSFQDSAEEEKVNVKIKDLYERIHFYKKAKSWVHSGLVDGDVFVAVLKYSTEMNAMLLNENMNYFTNGDDVLLTEEEIFSGYTSDEDTVLLETLFSEEIEAFSKGKDDEKKSKQEAIGEVKKKITNSIQNNIICMKDSKTDMKYGQYAFNSEVEGLDEKLTMPGCLVRTLPPESTIALALDDDICMGYLYFEKYDANSEFGREGFGLNIKDLLASSIGGDSYLNSVGSTASNMGSDFYMSTVTTNNHASDGNAKSADYFNSMKSSGINVAKTKFITELFVKGISKKLDKKIIENNQQFREIIYQLVKKDYLINKKVKIVYYAPNEVFHYKPDNDGGVYGNSKISKVYFYCKMLLSTLLTTVMQKISRGRDKRVLYVETGLDDDIEDSIQEVVRDFKAKEIQSDVLKNVSTVLRRVGAFEDYYIPRVDGETPLDFETISGMDVNLDDEFNQFLLKSIVSGMGVPSSFIESGNELEYSRELIMQNSSFIREIVAMQIDASKFLGDVFRQAFIYEYYDELGYETKSNGKTVKRPNSKKRKKDLPIDVSKIDVELPIPEFLNVSSTMEQIQNYTAQVEFVVQTVYPDELVNMDDKLGKERAIFKQRYTKSLIQSIDWTAIDEIIKETKIELNGEELADNANKDLDDALNGDGTDDLGGGLGGDMGDDMM